MRSGLVALVAAVSVGLVAGLDAQAPAPVPLPDLAPLHPSVATRLRDAHAALVEQLRRRDGSSRARGEALGRMGMLFMAARFFEEAERCFRDAQQQASDDFRWPYYLGHVLKNVGELPGAAESFERARRLRPGDVPTLVWLGRTYLDLARQADAEARLKEALAREPSLAAVRFEFGRLALARQDYRGAVDHLLATLTLDPSADAAHYPLGLAYRSLGDLEKAAYHLERRAGRGSRRATTGPAMPLPDPLLAALNGIVETPQAHRERGLDAAALGNWAEAVQHFRLAVEAEPDYAAMRVNLGAALERVGEARAALEQYEAALDLDPRLAEAHYGAGDLFERAGREQEAVEHYRAAVAENPTFVVAHARLADALRRTDRVEESLAHYRQVLALEPADVNARFGEAMALVRLGRYADARERLTEALRVHPDQPMFRQALARVLAAAPDDGVRDGAQAWKLVESLPEEQRHPGAFETLAMVLAELGHFDLAMDWQRLAMSAAARAGRPDVAGRMAANLARYQQGQPCRTPWRDDDPDHRPGPTIDPALLTPAPR
jgi:tetratricopeptide (TPR) repeat protein